MSFSAPEPDLAGFGVAQDYLRSRFGRDIRFYGPADIVYDPTVPASAFDDEGIPLDPLVGASATASAAVSIPNLTLLGSAHCNVVFKPLQTSIIRRDQTFETPLAMRAGLNRDLLVGINDAPLASRATHFQIGTLARDATGAIIYPEQWTPDEGELWKITDAKNDSFGTVQRYIVYGQGTL